MIADRPGVLAALAQVLGAHGISIASVIQHDPGDDDPAGSPVPLVIMTHLAVEAEPDGGPGRDRPAGCGPRAERLPGCGRVRITIRDRVIAGRDQGARCHVHENQVRDRDSRRRGRRAPGFARRQDAAPGGEHARDGPDRARGGAGTVAERAGQVPASQRRGDAQPFRATTPCSTTRAAHRWRPRRWGIIWGPTTGRFAAT